MKEEKHKLTFQDLVIMVLSVYVLMALLVDSFFRLSDEISRLLTMIDNGICIVFLYDFGYRFVKAESKLKFMRWGWIDLVSSIPMFGYLQYGRVFRLVRIIRIMRAFRSIRRLTQQLFQSKINGTFASASLIALLTVIFGSIAILQVERSAVSNIKTAEDAIWWAFTTITTIGYGDLYPVTVEGRLIAATLAICGMGLFGTFTGYVAHWFLGSSEQEKKADWVSRLEQLKELHDKGILEEEEFVEQKNKILAENMN
jgi:voltage-gated potassium channel